MNEVAVPSSTANDQGNAIHFWPNSWYKTTGMIASASTT